MATNEYDYTVNYDDERFQKVDEQAAQRETELDKTYAGMIGGAENIYQPQIDAIGKWGEQQQQLQQEQTNLAIEQIEQQKAQAHKDYQKEQSGAYVDWRKQSNQYGTEAEKMASSGLMGTGFSESSQVSMYNTYQNRVAQARESYDRVIMNYNNSINEAKLQNNSILAEIAYNTLSSQLELITEGTMYKNSLILDLADKKLQLQQMRDNNWYKVLDQINTENAMAQDDRQFYEGLDFEAEQNRLKMEFEEKQAELDRLHDENMAKINHDYEIALLNAKTVKEKELADYNYQIAKKEAADKLANDKALLQYQYDLQNTNSKGANMTFTKSGNPSVSQIKKDARSTKTTKTPSGSRGAALGNQIKSNVANGLLNLQSVISLGQGPMSTQKLASQVASGKVKLTTKNGKTTVSYNYPSANPLNKYR